MSQRSWSTLPNWNFRLFPRDTRTIIASVFLGLTVTVLLQTANVTDLALSGGAFPIMGVMVTSVLMIPAAAFYGFTGAFIVSLINPLLTNMMASNPMAPVYFANNIGHTFPIVLLVWLMKRPDRGLKLWQVVLVGVVGGLVDALVYAWGSHFLLSLPWGVIWSAVGVTQAINFVGCFVGFALCARLLKTKLIESSTVKAAPAK